MNAIYNTLPDTLPGSDGDDEDKCDCTKCNITVPLPFRRPDTQSSLLVVDMDGDGVETITSEEGVYFDHDGNRFAEKTAWAGADDALLVWDRNGNGLIDDGSELFGNNFLLQDGTKAANGFEALKEFDSNGDGIVDARDDRWSELQLWQDKNGNGAVDDGELLTMEEGGVAGLHTGYQDQNHTDESGNQHNQSGSFIRDDGTTGQMTDVWFQTDPMDSQFLDQIEISEDVKKLVNIMGSGNVASLHQVMESDESGRLRVLVEAFTNAPDTATANGISSLLGLAATPLHTAVEESM